MALNTNATALLSSGTFASRWLMWVEARNRSSGAVEALGLWTGDDNRLLRIGGQNRLHYGAGGMIALEDPVQQAGSDVRMHKVALGPLTPQVEQLLRGYEPRLAPAELHLAIFHPDTMALVDADRKIKGWIDSVTITAPELGGEAACEVVIASSARAGTQTLPLKKSDQSQRRRGGDRFRRYGDISNAVPVWWGDKKEKSS